MSAKASEPRIDIENLNDQRVVVWWYSAVKQNQRDRSQPKIVVSFRILNDDGSYGRIEKRQFPITYLGFLRLGSIWHRNRMIGCIDMKSCYFSGDISDSDIKIIRQGTGNASCRRYVIPKHIYDLEDDYYHNNSWLLKLPMEISNGQRIWLIIPCMEVFNRLYGRNAEVRRILTTYPWPEASKRLFIPETSIRDGDAWRIELPNRMTNTDTFLIAFLCHNQYSQMQAKSIYSQIESSQSFRGSSQTFLKIKPWHLGELFFKVKGFWIDKSQFLGLQINGANIEPDSMPIIRTRSHGSPSNDDNDDTGTTDSPIKNISNSPESVEVTGDHAPDHNSGCVKVADDTFEVLGSIGEVIIDNHTTASRGASHSSNDDTSEKFSGGDPYGNNKGVGKANIVSDIVIESEGMLMDFWKALLMVSKSEPNTIKKVMYYSNRDFFEGDTPTCEAFVNFFSNKQSFLESFPWGYVNVREKVYRGALIVRALTQKGYVYFVEIQRRKIIPRSNKNDDAKDKSVKEEMFRGVVFHLNKNDEVSTQKAINQVMFDLATNKGTLTLSHKDFDGEISSYVHRTKSAKNTGSEKKIVHAEMCKTIVRNALKKVL